MKDKKEKKEPVVMDRLHTAEGKNYNQEKIDKIIVETRDERRPGHHKKEETK